MMSIRGSRGTSIIPATSLHSPRFMLTTHYSLILFNQQQSSGRCQTQILRVSFRQRRDLFGDTPLKTNIEHNSLEVWKIIFLSKLVIYRFHVNLPGWYSMSRSYPSTSSCGSLVGSNKSDIMGSIYWWCVCNNKPFRRARLYKNKQTCTNITHSSNKWIVCSWFQKFTSLVRQFRIGLNKKSSAMLLTTGKKSHTARVWDLPRSTAGRMNQVKHDLKLFRCFQK